MSIYRKNWGLFTVMGAVWLLMAIFTSMTPLAYDDYSFALSAPQWKDVIPAAIHSYTTWNGRMVAEILGRVLMLLPTFVYVVATSTAFTALLACMLTLAYGKNWLELASPFSALLLFALTWFTVPAFGCAFFWRIGTANFLWTSLFVFACFVPYRLLLSQTTPAHLTVLRAILLGGLCFLAGWSNENLGILPLFFALFVFTVKYKSKTPFSRKYIAAAACIPLGFLCLILAPGNYLRLAQEIKRLPAWVQAGVSGKLVYWIDKMLMAYAEMCVGILVLVLLAFFCRKCRMSFSLPITSPLFLGGAFFVFAVMATGALFFSPSYPLRAFTGISLLYVQAALCLFVAVGQRLPMKKAWAVLVGVTLCLSVAYNLYIFSINDTINQERLRAYAENRGQDVVVRPYQKANKYFFISHHINDLQNRIGMNTLVANYYGLKSVNSH